MATFSEEELQIFQDACSKFAPDRVNVKTLLPSLILVTIMKTRFVALTIQIQKTTGNEISIELKSGTLDPELLEKLRKGTEKETKQQNKTPLVAALAFLVKTVENNRLLCFWTEANIIKKLDGVIDFRASEKNGSLSFQLVQKSYFLQVEISIPELYPERAPKLLLKSSNLSSVVMQILDGFVVSFYNKVHIWEEKKHEEARAAPSLRELQEMKHDVKFLKQAADLHAMSHQKEMRREKVVLIRAEVESEKKNALVQNEQDELKLPNFIKLITSLASIVQSLPLESCLFCKGELLPEDPSQVSSLKRDKEPERTMCGHWYHSGCLHNYITSPPFDTTKQCHKCNQRIWHRKWNDEYVRRYQKQLSLKMARDREISEVVEFLN